MAEQVNGLWQKEPWRHEVARASGHLPVLTWLFLVGLRPRSARRRFTGHRHCRPQGARGKPREKTGGSQVEERCKNFSRYSSGIDFAPRRPDFALAIVRRDEKLLAKALKGTIQSFREKWRLEKYVTPQLLRRYGTPEKVEQVAANQLGALNWAYSPWAVAMMCLAAKEGLGTKLALKDSSEFVPRELWSIQVARV